MGIGNTTSSSAITSVLCDIDAAEVTGLGTGIDKAGLAKKIKTIKRNVLDARYKFTVEKNISKLIQYYEK